MAFASVPHPRCEFDVGFCTGLDDTLASRGPPEPEESCRNFPEEFFQASPTPVYRTDGNCRNDTSILPHSATVA